MNSLFKKQGIRQATIIIAVATVSSQLLGLIRESIIARFLGTSAEYDILLVAMAMPMLVAGILFQAIPSAGIPYLSGGSNSTDTGKSNLNNRKAFLTINSILILILSAIAYFVIPLFKPLLVDGMTAEAADKVVKFSRIFCLIIPFRAYEAVFRSMLHIKRNFLFPSIAMLGFNVIVITFLLALFPGIGSPAFILAWITGMIVQCLIVAIPAFLLYSGKNKSADTNFESRSYVNFLGVIILIEAISILIDPFDRFICGIYLDAGHVSAVHYANIIYLVPVRVLMYSMATALFPGMAEMAREKDKRNLAAQYHKAIALAILVIIPVSMYMVIFRNEIVSLLFERGRFDSVSSQMTTEILLYYLAGMFFTSIYFIQSRVVYALKSWKVLILSRPAALIIKIGIAFWLIKSSWAIAIAGGTIALYAGSFIILEIFLISRAGLGYIMKDVRLIGKAILLAIGLIVVIWLANYICIDILLLSNLISMIICGIVLGIALVLVDQQFKLSGLNLKSILK